MHLNQQWNIQVRATREQLKSDICESEVSAVSEALEQGQLLNLTEARGHVTPSMETRVEQ